MNILRDFIKFNISIMYVLYDSIVSSPLTEVVTHTRVIQLTLCWRVNRVIRRAALPGKHYLSMFVGHSNLR